MPAFVLMTFALFVPDSIAAKTYTIAVIGTGDMGSVLGKKFAGAGHRIVYGSRDPSRDAVEELVVATGHGATATTQRSAAQQGEIVVLAVPWAPMEEIVKNLGELKGKILIDISTGARQAADGYLESAVESSTSELIQQWAPGARVVKTAFSAAQVIADPVKYDEPTVTYIAADDREAKEIVAELAIQLKLFPLDAGPLRMAKAIDHMGMLYLTPLIQGRDITWIWAPRIAVDYSCVSTEGWFGPVKDADNLARFSNIEGVKHQCPSK
jgi:predicted dinucleotide-binding enzyme